MSGNIHDLMYFNPGPPEKKDGVFGRLWVLLLIAFISLPHLGFECLFVWCILNDPMWIVIAAGLATAGAILVKGISSAIKGSKSAGPISGADYLETKRMTTDPNALAEQLVREAPPSRARNFDHLELEATRWLVAELQGDALERALSAVRKRLAEILDIPLPTQASEPKAPAGFERKPASAQDLESQAEAIVGAAFSAPFDGAPERLEVLVQRARRSCDGLKEKGLSVKTIELLIAREVEALKENWSRPSERD